MPTLPMFAPEDHARILDPEAPLVAPRGQNPLPLEDRIADLATSTATDATGRLRAIGEWLHGLGGDEAMRAATLAAAEATDDRRERHDIRVAVARAWHGIGSGTR